MPVSGARAIVCCPLAVIASISDEVTRSARKDERDKGKALAGKSTLNRLELTKEDANRKSPYKKIVANDDKLREFFVKQFLKKCKKNHNLLQYHKLGIRLSRKSILFFVM